MTYDDGYALDNTERLAQKRGQAIGLLDTFWGWQGAGARDNSSAQLVYVSLARDILLGTELDVTLMISRLTEQNEQALLKKLAESL